MIIATRSLQAENIFDNRGFLDNTFYFTDVRVDSVPFTAEFYHYSDKIELWHEGKLVATIPKTIGICEEKYVDRLISHFFLTNSAIRYFLRKKLTP